VTQQVVFRLYRIMSLWPLYCTFSGLLLYKYFRRWFGTCYTVELPLNNCSQRQCLPLMWTTG